MSVTVNRFGFLLALALSLCINAFTQTKQADQRPNFSGEWHLDRSESASRSLDAVYKVLAKESAKAGLRAEVLRILRIVHVDPELRMTVTNISSDFDKAGNLVGKNESESRSEVLFTDGRKQEGTGPSGRKIVIQTEWKGARIWSTSTYDAMRPLSPASGREPKFYSESYETTYSISEDGKVFTVESWMRRENDTTRHFPSKLVYRRVEASAEASRD